MRLKVGFFFPVGDEGNVLLILRLDGDLHTEAAGVAARVRHELPCEREVRLLIVDLISDNDEYHMTTPFREFDSFIISRGKEGGQRRN